MKKFIILSLLLINSSFAYEIKMNFAGEIADTDRVRLENIAQRIKVLASSSEFKQLAREYREYSCTDLYNFPQNVSNIEESLNFIDQAQVQIDVSFFTANNSVVASTGVNSIAFNTNMFYANSDSAVANTLFHESLHALGFSHCNKNNIRLFPKIKRSIPYKFGDFIQEVY
jgi:Flp pilus assembly secretin CpaC